MVAARQDFEQPAHDGFTKARQRMVREQIANRGVHDPRVLAAMARVPRHRFVPDKLVQDAYADFPVAIAHGQTVSQPYIVAYMTEAPGLAPGARVLEIGTGSGYQAAVLAEVGYRVWTIEIRPLLAHGAESTLRELGYDDTRLHLRCGDGTLGWPEAAPFDGILAAAAPRVVPPALLEQLTPGGVLLIPLGENAQSLWRYRRTAAGFQGEELFAVRFVPMVEHA